MPDIHTIMKHLDEDNSYPVLADNDCIYREKLIKENWAGNGIHIWSISFKHSSGPTMQIMTLKADEIGKKFPQVVINHDYQGTQRKHILITKKQVIENPELKRAYIILYKIDYFGPQIYKEIYDRLPDDMKHLGKDQLKHDIMEDIMRNK